MRRAGVPSAFASPRSAALFLLTSGASFAAIAVAGAATGLGLLPAGVSWVGTLLPAALAVVAMAAVGALGRLSVTEPSETQGLLARWVRRIEALLRDGVQETVALLRTRDPLVIGGCLGYLAFAIAALGAAFQAVGGAGSRSGRSSWRIRSGRSAR